MDDKNCVQKKKKRKRSESSSDSEQSVLSSSESNYDNDSESDNEINKNTAVYQEGVSNDIKTWAVDNGIRHKHLDGLLDILRTSYLPTLPKSSKTFLESNIKFDIQYMEASGEDSKGEYYYFGIKKKLHKIVLVKLHKSSVLEIIIFVDGISPWKSSPKQCWPTVCKLYHEKDIYEPFTVAIYAGEVNQRMLMIIVLN